MDIQDWSVTAASNTDIDGTNIDEGCDPANVNNAIRAVMANIAGLRDLVGGAKTSGGSANAQTLTTGLSLSAYQQGLPLAFEAGATNTGAMTMNVDTIGAKSVKQVDGSDPPAGAVTAGGIYLLAYEAGADVLLLLNPTPLSAADLQAQGDVLDDLNTLGAVGADGQMIVGTGAGVFAYESGATLRTSIGVGTGDSPQFTGLTLTGAFTSRGIDDNATGERLQLADALASLGASGAAYSLAHAADDVSLVVAGGNSGSSGANFVLYGGSHASRASDFEFRADSTVIWDWDESASELTLTEDFLMRAGVFIDERASARPDRAGFGQFWVLDNTPNDPMFTDDAGNDFQLATLAGTETLTNKTLGAAALSGTLAAADNLVTRPKLQDYGETVNAIGSVGGGAQAIDLELGNVVTATVDTSETTFSFSNPPASGTAGSFTLILTNGGSQTVNWPASVDWAGGGAPSLTASGVDILTFVTTNGGTTWFGFAAGLDMQ